MTVNWSFSFAMTHLCWSNQACHIEIVKETVDLLFLVRFSPHKLDRLRRRFASSPQQHVNSEGFLSGNT